MFVESSFLPFVQKLYSNLKGNGSENFFVSPISIYSTMALVLAGSENESQKELLKLLELNDSSDFIATVKSTGGYLQDASKEDTQKTVSQANGVFINTGFNVKDTFKSLLETHFLAQTQLVNFEGNPDASRKSINAWISEATKDKIKELLKEGSITNMTRLVLANAIYFKGTWAQKFAKESTEEGSFYGLDDKEYKVPMMTLKKKFKFTKLFDYHAVALRIPFQCHEMLIVLPDVPKGLNEVLEIMTNSKEPGFFKAMLDKNEYEEIEVILKMPKFKLGGANSMELKPILQKMGVPSIFSVGKADFSGITGDKSLYVSAVVHQAVIEVDEEGAEAAAATGAVMMMRMAPLRPVAFTMDHPFSFFILSDSGFPLFMGHYVKPMPE